MRRILGVSRAGSVSILACFSLMTALACGGLAGCGSSNATSPPSEDGGEGGMGEGGDAQEEMSPTPEAGMDAAKDSPVDSPVTEDAPADSPADSPADAPKDAPADAPGDGCTGAVAVFSTGTVSLGNGNCGGAAVTKTYTIQNTGCTSLTVGATTSGTGFSVSPSSLMVAAGMTGTLTVSATVAQSSTAGSAISGSLKLTTNDPAHASGTIPLSVTPTGATLAWAASSPTTANFGVQPINQAATPITLTLDNTGNAAVSITLATPSNSQFTISPSTANIAAAGNSTLTAGFTPNTTTASSATSSFTVTGAVCGTSVSSLSFSGQGGTGSVTGWPTGTEDFGGGACGGSAPAAQTFTLTNSGSVAAHITAITFAGYSGYATNATVGEAIPANGGSITVSLSAPVIPYPSAVPGSYGGSVTFTTDVAGDTPHQINLTEHAVGAILAWDTSATPGFGNFGTVPAGTNANQSFAVVNSGNASSSVTLAANTPFSILPATFNVSGGSNQSDTASFSPQTFGPFTSPLVMSGTNLCQPVPAALNLTGTGQAGGLSLSSQSLAFTVNCGQTATAQTITLTNQGNAPFNWNAQLPNGMSSDTLYSFSPASGTIGANGGTATITVSPVAMPQYPTNTNPSAFADSITITTNIPNDTAHTVSLSETPLGDILSVKPSSLNFGSIPVSTSSTAQTFVVVNGANAGTPTANVTVNSSDGVDFPVNGAASITTTAAPGGQSADISVQFNAPANPGPYTSNIDLATSDVLCAPLPTSPAVAASGTATQAGPIIGPQALNFGLVNCGGPAASPQQITAGNNGSQTYTITGLTLGKGANSPFTVSMTPASGVVPVGGSVTITVTPSAIPGTEPNGQVPDSSYWSDSLLITTNANVTSPICGNGANGTCTASLTMGAQGVIITNNLASTNWGFGTVNFGATGYYNVPIRNAGNAPADVTLSGFSYSNPNIFGPQNTPITVNDGTGAPNPPVVTTISGTFTPPSGSGSWTDQATLSVTPATGFTLCAPLPASWQTPTITFTGGASNNPVVSVSPTSLQFPSVNCGATPAAESVTLINSSSTSQSYSVYLGGGGVGAQSDTYYQITAGGPNGSIAGGGNATITVQPTNLAGDQPGASQYDDQLVVVVNGTSTYIPITMTVEGAILSFTNEGDFNFGYTSEYIVYSSGTDYPNNPQVLNSGNVAATNVQVVFLAGTYSADYTYSPSSLTIQPNASGSFQLNVTTGNCNYPYMEQQVTLTAGNLCGTAPTVTVTGCY
jgi:hypothetical protein